MHALGIIEAVTVADVGASVKAVLDRERDRVMALALETAEADELIARWLGGVRGLPGFGDASALRLLAYSGDLRRFGSARQFAAFTGLVPRFKQSGGRPEVGVISRIGSAELRGVLYWAAMSASQSRSVHGDFYRRLRANGKCGKVAMVALANRLARAAWSVCVR
jgi:transposase